MTQTIGEEVDVLRAAIGGDVVVPSDAEYDEARKVWNAAIDRRPSVIAQCTSALDVSVAIRFAVQHGLEIAVRGGAHGVSGKACVDDGLMIDLRRLNSVVVDPVARRARVGGGALLADMIAATQEHGLATPCGMVGHTGVGGLTLGGGMGWLTRKHGMSIDNLLSVEIVTADGEIRHASSDENADLFWAIRGGGGNFGVVTEFEFALYPVGPIIQFGMLFWELDKGPEMLRMVRDVCADLPPGVNVVVGALNAPPAPFVPAEHHFTPGYALILAGFGSPEEHLGVVESARARVAPLWDAVMPMPFLDLQLMLDEANRWGQYNYEKGAQVRELSDEVIDVLTERVPLKSSPGSVVLMYRVDSAYSAVGDDETAYGGDRSPGYYIFNVAVCETPDLLPVDREWARSIITALLPYTVTRNYVNALDEDHSDVRAAFGDAKYERLAQIKRIYDPDNVFHRNANILPA
jgi:FAD/FMN-containing dehydrogenase